MDISVVKYKRLLERIYLGRSHMRYDIELFDKLKDQDWSYEDVARERGINPEKFAQLMRERFDTPENAKEGKTFHLPYALEWAERIATGNHYNAADAQTSEVLDKVGL